MMVGGYLVAEAMVAVALVLAASAFTSNMFNVLREMEQAGRDRLVYVRKEVQTRLEPVFIHVSENKSHLYFWVKNTGLVKLSHSEIAMTEVFVIGRQLLENPRYCGEPPCWSYELVKDVFDDNGWSWGETVKITVKLRQPLGSGEYLIRLSTLYTRVDHVFSVGD